MWNCFFRVLLFCYDKFLALQCRCRKTFKRLETYVLNDTFIQIKFYNVDTGDVFLLYNNANFFRMLFLGMLKGLFRYSVIHRYMHLKYILTHVGSERMGEVDRTVFPIMEVIYYKNGLTKRYFSKNIVNASYMTTLLRYGNSGSKDKYLHVSISDKYNITKFIHKHMDSFTAENGITVDDLYRLYRIIHNIDDTEHLDNVYCQLIEDNTLEEHVLQADQVLAIA